MKHNLYMYIFVMAVVTYLIRMLPLTLIRKEIKNTFIKSFLYYVPYVRKSLICVSLFSCAGVFLVELLTGL